MCDSLVVSQYSDPNNIIRDYGVGILSKELDVLSNFIIDYNNKESNRIFFKKNLNEVKSLFKTETMIKKYESHFSKYL